MTVAPSDAILAADEAALYANVILTKGVVAWLNLIK